jgi:hypothetical protein
MRSTKRDGEILSDDSRANRSFRLAECDGRVSPQRPNRYAMAACVIQKWDDVGLAKQWSPRLNASASCIGRMLAIRGRQSATGQEITPCTCD